MLPSGSKYQMRHFRPPCEQCSIGEWTSLYAVIAPFDVGERFGRIVPARVYEAVKPAIEESPISAHGSFIFDGHSFRATVPPPR